jgi:hypothetical protein
MGSLKPGATYIYERDKGVVYAREFGADPSTRVEIGWDYVPSNEKDNIIESNMRDTVATLREDQLWGNIRREARANPTLQKALERAIMIYKLSKDKV